jgi:putative spermidine/putrescine transport system substrate-binding protein
MLLRRALFLATAGWLAGTAVAQAQDSLTVLAFGGNFQQQMRDAWFKPAADQIGVRLVQDTITNVSELRAHVQAGSKGWDVVMLSGPSCETARQEGLFEPLGLAPEQTEGIPPSMVTDRYVGVLQYGAMLTWNPARFKGAAPQNWADFFDVKKFPGTRALDSRPTFTLEIALLADGVKPSELYPLDVERAFRKLEQIKPHITAYYANGAVATQLLKDGEIDLLPLYENRIFAAKREGVALAYTLDQAVIDINCLAIPKGSTKIALARRFIAAITEPRMNARIANHSDMSPTNRKAFETGVITPERAAELSLSSAVAASQVALSYEWWAPRNRELALRYKAFIGQ